MTVERRIIAGVADIRAVRLECTNPECGRELLFSADSGMDLARLMNPSCALPWLTPSVTHMEDNDKEGYFKFLNLVRPIKEKEELGAPPFRIRFEFAEPND